MKKIVCGAITSALLSACSTAPQYVLAPGVVSHDSINPVQTESGNFVGAVWFRKPWTQVEPVKLQQCLQANANPRQVTVASLHHSGLDRAEAADHNRAMADAVQKEQPQKTRVMTGVTTTDPAVAFRLALQTGPTSNYYYFDRIGRASSSGFQPVGAWEEADPMQAQQALAGTVARVQNCLYRYATNEPSPGNDIIEHQPPLDETKDLNLPQDIGRGMDASDLPSGGLHRQGEYNNPGSNGLMDDKGLR